MIQIQHLTKRFAAAGRLACRFFVLKHYRGEHCSARGAQWLPPNCAVLNLPSKNDIVNLSSNAQRNVRLCLKNFFPCCADQR